MYKLTEFVIIIQWMLYLQLIGYDTGQCTCSDIFLIYYLQERLDLLPSLLINKQDTKEEDTKKTKRT